mmetsp:Transcript_32080/g.59720  ORF Transcript_32080/g.59720 Transcript_32080/m.59720 type:complete len:457 (-) Transcript_32080:160-1530(-)
MPRAKKLLKRKQKKQSAGGSLKKEKHDDKKNKEQFCPDDITKPIPNGQRLWVIPDEKRPENIDYISIVERKKISNDVPSVSPTPLGPPAERKDAKGHEWRYYVHFVGRDRRMDRWVNYEQLRFAGPDLNIEEHHDNHGFDEQSLKNHEEATKVKNVDAIEIGPHVMETWYFSPFPAEYTKYRKLFFCEFCLKFFGLKSELRRHSQKCTWTHPPGNEIYRSKDQNIEVAMFEVDGGKEIIYTQNICYIAKLFLDHKTLWEDTTPFLFYVLTEVTPRGCCVVGYFSKEKSTELVSHGNNVACILTLPCHQRKGFGKFLISLSYELSKLEGKTGSPEEPISDLGQQAYNSYWKGVILDILADPKHEEITIHQISQMTSMTYKHIEQTLKALDIIQYDSSEGYMISVPNSLIKSHLDKKKRIAADKTRKYVRPADPKKVRWSPHHAKLIHKKARVAAQNN